MELIETHRQSTVAILRYLLVECKNDLKVHFCELPFLPRGIPDLDQIHASIDEVSVRYKCTVHVLCLYGNTVHL